MQCFPHLWVLLLGCWDRMSSVFPPDKPPDGSRDLLQPWGLMSFEFYLS